MRRTLRAVTLLLILLMGLTGLLSGQGSERSETEANPRQVTQVDSNAEIVAGKFAILVGVDQYDPQQFAEVVYTRKDAEDLSARLVEIGYPEDNIRLLVGDDARYDPILDTIDTLINCPELVVHPDTLIFFFSGHGMMDDAGTSYLIPQDGTSHKDRAPQRNISLDMLAEKFNQTKFPVKVMLVDACRNVPGVKGLEVTSVGDWAPPSHAIGFKVIYSTMPGDPSWEYAELENGLFTHYLLEGLVSRKAAMYSGKITVGSLFSYLHDEMDQFSTDQGRPQVPVERGETTSITLAVLPVSEATASITEQGILLAYASPNNSLITIERDVDSVEVARAAGTVLSVSLPAGDYTLSASAENFSSQEKQAAVIPGETREVHLTLERVGVINMGKARRMLENSYKTEGEALIFAAIPGQSALESSSLGQGIFTYAVLQGLNSANLSEEGFLAVDTLFGFTEDYTTTITREFSDFGIPPQTPQFICDANMGSAVIGVGNVPELIAEFANQAYALVCGINQFENNPGYALRCAVSDAQAIAEMLVGRCGYDPEHIIILKDEQVTKAGLFEALDDLDSISLSTTQDDSQERSIESTADLSRTILFYFSGFGSSIANGDYLIMYDGSFSNDAMALNLSVNTLLDRVEELGFDRRVFILDMARNVLDLD